MAVVPPPPPPDCLTGSACNLKPTYTYLHTVVNNVPFFTMLPGVPQNSQWLIVSNAPETIREKGIPLTLYKFTGETGDAVSVRVYFWHLVRQNPTPSTVGLLISSALPGGEIVAYSRFVITASGTGDIVTPGMCLAERQLYGPLEIQPDVGPFPGWGAEQVIWSHTVDAGSGQVLVASTHEFLIRGAVSPVTIRTAIQSAGLWGNSTDTPAPPGAHVRGWWPYSKILCLPKTGGGQAAPAYEFSTGGTGDPFQYAVCNGFGSGDSDAYAKQVADTYGTGNKGCYGANLVYRLPAETALGGNLYVGMRSRDAGGKYAAAARIIAPTLLPEMDVPKYPCQHSGDPEDHHNFFDLMQALSPDNSFGRPAGSSIYVDVEVVNGGAAAMPTNLLLSRMSAATT